MCKNKNVFKKNPKYYRSKFSATVSVELNFPNVSLSPQGHSICVSALYNSLAN